MRNHQTIQKKSAVHIAPTSTHLESRPFAVQSKPEEQTTQAKLGGESTLSNFPILNPAGGQAIPLQPKLEIGQPNDQYEQEADLVAKQVVQRLNAPPSSQSNQPPTLQRQEQRADEEKLQMKSMPKFQAATAKTTATPDLGSSIQRLKGGGQPLGDRIQQPMEQAFGADFSEVRIHADSESHQLSQSIQAKAFTTGKDIFFSQGAYEPSSPGGKELLAHELTHVVQQNESVRAKVQLKPLADIQRSGETETSSLQSLSISTTQNNPIQRYPDIDAAADPSRIAERHFGTGDGIVAFTGMDSCIGVIGRNGNDLTGVHLSLMDENDVSLADENANQQTIDDTAVTVAGMVGANDCQFVGLVNEWEDGCTMFMTALQQFTGNIPTLGNGVGDWMVTYDNNNGWGAFA